MSVAQAASSLLLLLFFICAFGEKSEWRTRMSGGFALRCDAGQSGTVWFCRFLSFVLSVRRRRHSFFLCPALLCKPSRPDPYDATLAVPLPVVPSLFMHFSNEASPFASHRPERRFPKERTKTDHRLSCFCTRTALIRPSVRPCTGLLKVKRVTVSV